MKKEPIYLTSIVLIKFNGMLSGKTKALNFYGLNLDKKVINESEMTLIVIYNDFEYVLKMIEVSSRDENNLVCSEYTLGIL